MTTSTFPQAVASGTTRAGVYYEVHGKQGRPLFLGFPIMASPDAFPSGNARPVVHRFLEQLTDRYQVLVADYPSVGRSATLPPSEFTTQRVCADLLGVADAAGFQRFAWWGGTFGAVTGLLLATRTDRLSALVSIGWPPLGAPYATMLRGTRINVTNPPPHSLGILRSPGQYAQWVTFYESLEGWPEAAEVSRISCPRLVAYGANYEADVAGIPLHPAATIRERRSELEAFGWRVIEVPDCGAGLLFDPETQVPIVRGFLDRIA
jgi:pimeloyl-ACP methyl ester carboxylesterase